MLLFLNVIYVLVAIAMIALILMQRGAGAQAGSGFGGGASATVFGARGASSFLTQSTKWLAITFFAISLFMAWYATRSSVPATVGEDIGIMSQVPVAPGSPAPDASVPAAPQQSPAEDVPSVPEVPQAAEPPESAPPGTAEN